MAETLQYNIGPEFDLGRWSFFPVALFFLAVDFTTA